MLRTKAQGISGKLRGRQGGGAVKHSYNLSCNGAMIMTWGSGTSRGLGSKYCRCDDRNEGFIIRGISVGRNLATGGGGRGGLAAVT